MEHVHHVDGTVLEINNYISDFEDKILDDVLSANPI